MELSSSPPSLNISWLQSNVQYSSLTILAFDYTLTFGDEIEYIWKERWRMGTFLYFFCRYAVLSNTIFAIFDALDNLKDRSTNAFLVAVWGLRTYAIYGQSKKLLALLGTLALACLACDITQIPFSQCLGVATNVLTLAFVLITSGFATAHVWTSFRHRDNILVGRKKSLESIIFRQGLLYLLAVVVFYTAALCLNFTAFKARDRALTQGSASTEYRLECYEVLHRLLNALKLPVPCLLTARFILRLRKWQRHRQELSQLTGFPPITPLAQASGQSHGANDLSLTPPETTRREPRVCELRELGEDIGPRPSSGFPSLDWFKDYEWDWDRLDREELEERWKGALEEMYQSGEAGPLRRTSSLYVCHEAPDDIESCISDSDDIPDPNLGQSRHTVFPTKSTES
ncbi:hypothetical protein FA13DRAFT_1723747 [Coprinellus micaceus]|uniref:DUF6533 domain-containing protein n=1 Tax=Coprinellus micaceus TaxID=71717 RepID=A0A4Y7TZD8_COPMI|nr:hypothetical protein FA13DRAFT_1723747 [Coprinellus micaceus]